MSDLNKHLALKVMGWKSDSRAGIYLNPKNSNWWQRVEDWNPTENIEQAMMCLETFALWEIQKFRRGGYMVIIDRETLVDGVAVFFKLRLDDKLSRCVSLCCAGFTEWEEVNQ